MQGVPNDETLDVDDIQAGASFGDHPSLDSTLKHMRALSQPRFTDRRVREDRHAMGANDVHSVGKEAAKQILEERHRSSLSGDVADATDAVVKEAQEPRRGH